MPKTRNRRTGVIAETQQHIIDHEVLGADLELVDEDEKPLVPELISEKSIARNVETKRSNTKNEE